MRLGTILIILALPICAQATICEQFLAISDLVRQSKSNAYKEWKDRSAWRKVLDYVGGLAKPEGILFLPEAQLTKEIANHFDQIVPVGDGILRLVRYPSEARDHFEKAGKYESIKISRLTEQGEYLLHLTPDPARPAYLSGRITKLVEDGFDFLDYDSRTLFRVSGTEFVSAKSVDLGHLGGEQLKPTPHDSAAVWSADCGRQLAEFLREKMDSAAKLVLQVKDGSSYGIPGFHKIPLMQLAKVQILDRGIYIPELGITVSPDQVLVVSTP